MQNLRRFTTRHGFLAYCTISYAIGLPLFAAFPIASPGLQFPLLIAGSYAPALAALIVSQIIADPRAQPSLKDRLLHWQVPAAWYIFAVLIPTVTCLGLYFAQELNSGPAWLGGLAALPLIFLTNFGEEVGWRGFALPRLMQNHSLFTASLWVGVFWTVYHAPLYWDRPLDGLLFLGPILPLSVLLAWFFKSTGGSVLVCTLFHATFNTWMLVLASPTSTTPLLIGQITIYIVLAVTLRMLNGPSLTGISSEIESKMPESSS